MRGVVTEMQTGEALDLVAALKAVASGIPAPAIEVHAPDGLALTDKEAVHALFRCVQEAITNAVKHASARHIRVDVTRDAQALRITVQDDGSGVRTVKPGNGLQGMIARLSSLGGEARFTSAPGDGFRVTLELPERAP